MIPVWMLSATDNKVASLDDAAVSTDLGNQFLAEFLCAQFGKGAWSKFREFVQQVFIVTSATVTVTPLIDGSVNAADTQTFSLTAAGGAYNRVQCKLSKTGTRHAVFVQVTAHSGTTELGESERVIIPRRTQR